MDNTNTHVFEQISIKTMIVFCCHIIAGFCMGLFLQQGAHFYYSCRNLSESQITFVYITCINYMQLTEFNLILLIKSFSPCFASTVGLFCSKKLRWNQPQFSYFLDVITRYWHNVRNKLVSKYRYNYKLSNICVINFVFYIRLQKLLKLSRKTRPYFVAKTTC